MSVRARRINRIEYESDNTFNLSFDEELMDFLERKGFYESLNQDNVGITEVTVETLQEALDEVVGLDKDLRKSIETDIAWAKKKGEDYIQYYCF